MVPRSSSCRPARRISRPRDGRCTTTGRRLTPPHERRWQPRWPTPPRGLAIHWPSPYRGHARRPGPRVATGVVLSTGNPRLRPGPPRFQRRSGPRRAGVCGVTGLFGAQMRPEYGLAQADYVVGAAAPYPHLGYPRGHSTKRRSSRRRPSRRRSTQRRPVSARPVSLGAVLPADGRARPTLSRALPGPAPGARAESDN